MSAELEPHGSVIYTATDPDTGFEERELTHVFVGSSGVPPAPDPLEVAEFDWVGIAELEARIDADPGLFAPWLPSILKAQTTKLSHKA